MKPVSEINVPAGEALRELKVTLKVTGMRKARARLWVGARLFRFAAWATGCQGEMYVNGERV